MAFDIEKSLETLLRDHNATIQIDKHTILKADIRCLNGKGGGRWRVNMRLIDKATNRWFVAVAAPFDLGGNRRTAVSHVLQSAMNSLIAFQGAGLPAT